MADFGHIVLVIGLVAAIYSAVATWAGARLEHRLLAASARSGLFFTFGMVTMATVGLLVALIGHDFKFDYVAAYTSRDMSLPYLISALWAGNAGSLLLWAWLLTVFAVLMVLWKHKAIEKLLPHAIPIVMATTAFFLVLLVFVASPFDRLASVPRDGTGLNPNPAITWIWIGGGFLTLGGVIALWGRRTPPVSAPAFGGDAALEEEIGRASCRERV